MRHGLRAQQLRERLEGEEGEGLGEFPFGGREVFVGDGWEGLLNDGERVEAVRSCWPTCQRGKREVVVRALEEGEVIRFSDAAQRYGNVDRNTQRC